MTETEKSSSIGSSEANLLVPETFEGEPLLFEGAVIHGFGRGSKQLGIPTANLGVDQEPRVQSPDFRTGIYLGWATLDRKGPVYPMVMSIGWNPFYRNTVKTMEAHLIHQFDQDFYGVHLRLCVVGYLRPERDFTSLEALIDAIKLDIRSTEAALKTPALAQAASHAFLVDPQ